MLLLSKKDYVRLCYCLFSIAILPLVFDNVGEKRPSVMTLSNYEITAVHGMAGFCKLDHVSLPLLKIRF